MGGRTREKRLVRPLSCAGGTARLLLLLTYVRRACVSAHARAAGSACLQTCTSKQLAPRFTWFVHASITRHPAAQTAVVTARWVNGYVVLPPRPFVLDVCCLKRGLCSPLALSMQASAAASSSRGTKAGGSGATAGRSYERSGLTAEEIEEIREAFNLFDTDGSGV